MDDISKQITDTGQVPQIPASALRVPEDQHGSTALPGNMTDMSSDLEKSLSNIFPQVLKAEKQKAENDKQTSLAEAKYLGQQRENLSRIEKDNPINPVDFGKQPKAPEANPLENFGSLASVIGIFASAFTKKPIINALNASAAAMTAQREGDLEKFNEAYKEWQDSMSVAMKRHDIEVETLKEKMELAQTDQPLALAQLKAYGAAHNSEAASVLAQMGDMEEFGKYVNTMQMSREKLIENHQRSDEFLLKKQEALQKQQIFKDSYQENIDNGQSPALAEANALMASQGKKTSTLTGKKALEDIIADPDSSDEEVQLAQARLAKITQSEKQTPVLSDEDYQKYKGLPEVKEASENLHKGMLPAQAMPGLSANNPLRAAAMRLHKEEYPDEDTADTHLGYVEKTSEQRTLGTQVPKIKLASNILENSIPSLIDQAKKLGLSPSMDLNAVVNFARHHMSSKEYNNFSTQLRAVTTDYAQFIGRGRPTVHSDEEALKILSENGGITSLEGFQEAVGTERGNVYKGIDQTKAETGSDKKISKTDDNGLPPEARRQLTEGHYTTFANGQVWGLENGNPVRVK